MSRRRVRIFRRGTRVPPYGTGALSTRRGRRPRRPISAALPRCKAPSGRGLSAQPTGGEKNAWHLSLRQRFALTPPSQREARGDGFPRQCSHWLEMTGNGRTESFAPTRGYRRFLRGTSYPKGICSAALHGRTASSTIFARENGDAYASG